MALRRDETFFVYLPLGTEEACEGVGKALEIVVRVHTVTGSTARIRTAEANGAQRAIMTTGSGSIIRV